MAAFASQNNFNCRVNYRRVEKNWRHGAIAITTLYSVHTSPGALLKKRTAGQPLGFGHKLVTNQDTNINIGQGSCEKCSFDQCVNGDELTKKTIRCRHT